MTEELHTTTLSSDPLNEAAIRRDEREKCCRDYCRSCNVYDPVCRGDDGVWRHSHQQIACTAWYIRERAYREEVGK